MDSLKTLKSPLQCRWFAFLSIAAYVLGIYHLLFAAFRYVVSGNSFGPFAEAEFWFAVGFFAVSAFSVLAFLFFFPQRRSTIEGLFCRMLSYEQVFVALFPLWYILVCFIRQSSEQLPYLLFLKNEIAFSAVSGLILFPLARFVRKKKSFPLIEVLLHLVVLSYTIFTVISLYYAFHLEDLVLPSGNEAGLTDQMQLILGAYYNMTGAIACLMFALSLYLVFSQKFWLKILYFIIALIHLLVVILSNSRTDFLGALFVIVFASFCYLWYFLEKKKVCSLLLRILICTFCSCVFGLLFWNLRPVIITLFDQASGFSSSRIIVARTGRIIQPSQLSSHLPSYRLSSLAASARKVTADLNGRGNIWRAALKVIVYSPLNFLFGVTPGGITNALIEIGGLTEKFYGTHNAFIDVAAEFGVPAFLAFVIFSVKMVIRCFRVLFRIKGENFKKTFMIPLTIFTLFLLNLTEGYLVAYFCIQSYIFYLFCGWILALDNA